MDTCRAPTVFWGRQGGQGQSPEAILLATALILMGDWCGPVPTPHEGKPGRERWAEARCGGIQKKSRVRREKICSLY